MVARLTGIIEPNQSGFRITESKSPSHDDLNESNMSISEFDIVEYPCITDVKSTDNKKMRSARASRIDMTELGIYFLKDD